MSDPYQSPVPAGVIALEPAVDANVAFSVDRVFRFGIAFVREAPRVALLGAGLSVLLQVAPSYAGLCLSVGGALASPNDPQAAQQYNLAGNLAQLVLQVLVAPLVGLLYVGLVAAAGEHVRTGSTSTRTLYASALPFVRWLLYQILVGALSFLVAAIVWLLPVAGILAAAYATKSVALAIGGSVGWSVVCRLVMYFVIDLGTRIGGYAAIVDDVWPIDALAIGWRSARGARLTLWVTAVVFGCATCASTLLAFFLIGLPLLAGILAVQAGGMGIAWILHTTPAEERQKIPFFQRHAGDL